VFLRRPVGGPVRVRPTETSAWPACRLFIPRCRTWRGCCQCSHECGAAAVCMLSPSRSLILEPHPEQVPELPRCSTPTRRLAASSWALH
jgi:hypothetical protein